MYTHIASLLLLLTLFGSITFKPALAHAHWLFPFPTPTYPLETEEEKASTCQLVPGSPSCLVRLLLLPKNFLQGTVRLLLLFPGYSSVFGSDCLDKRFYSGRAELYSSS